MRITLIVLWFSLVALELMRFLLEMVPYLPWDYYFQWIVNIFVALIGPIALISNKKVLTLAAYISLIIDLLSSSLYIERAQSIPQFHSGLYSPLSALILKLIILLSLIVVGGNVMFQRNGKFKMMGHLQNITKKSTQSLIPIVSIFIAIEYLFCCCTVDFNHFKLFSVDSLVILIITVSFISFVIGFYSSHLFTLFSYCISLGLFIYQLPNLIKYLHYSIVIALENNSVSVLFSDDFNGYFTGAICLVFSLPAFILTLRKIDPVTRISDTIQLDQF